MTFSVFCAELSGELFTPTVRSVNGGNGEFPQSAGFLMANSASKSYCRVPTGHKDGHWVVASDQHRPAGWRKAGIRDAPPDSQVRCLHACQAASGATPPAIASLIENAAASFELDRNASREYLFRAFSLLRAQARPGTDRTAVMTRGRLATWQVQRVIDYIEANLGGRIEARELPRLVNLSTSHFFRAFKISVGIPPHEYITQRRIDRVLHMLRMTSVPLLQIAVECGLRDQSNLCRVFRRVVGQSPSEWRRSNTVDPRQVQAIPNQRHLWTAPDARPV
jgi:AraC family transcriptional regulator